MVGNALRIVEIYNKIDKFMDQKYPDERYIPFSRKVSALASQEMIINEYREELLLLAEIRNILVHEALDSEEPMLMPSDKLISTFEKISSRITQPPKALDTVAVPFSRIFSVRPGDSVLETIKKMHQNGYSHAPVLRDNRVTGVFSESSIMAYLAEGNSFDTELKIFQLQQVLQLSKYKTERYRFTPADSSVFDVEQIFRQAYEKGTRVAVVFLTSDGTKNGVLEGMVTNFNAAFYK
ncbi:MAG TPA: CBS domain-containing protein [Clostridia bacterium]|nr:CBS domain-containing protein [Clostridia bacterium]